MKDERLCKDLILQIRRRGRSVPAVLIAAQCTRRQMLVCMMLEDEYTKADMADRLGISEEAVRGRLNKAKTRIMKLAPI